MFRYTLGKNLKFKRAVFQVRQIMNQQQKQELKFKQNLQEQQKRRKWSTIVTSSIAVLLGTSGVLYLWQPWNPFSSEVSKHLRKGLWLETSKNIDYLKALGHYQDALRQCRKENMDNLDPRFTGIVLKIAEMYGLLEMVDRQRDVYQRLSDYLFAKLVNNEVPEEWKDQVIQRDLIVSTRLATLARPGETLLAMQELWDRMVFTEQQMVDKVPALKVEGDMDIFEVLKIDSWLSKRRFIKENIPGDIAWPRYMEDLVRARDLYATLAMFTKREDDAINLLQSNILFIKVSGLEPIKISTELLNLASAYYFKSESPKDKTGAQQARTMSERLFYTIINEYQGEDEESAVCRAMSLYSLGIIKKGSSDGDRLFQEARDLATNHGLLQVIEKIDSETIQLPQI
ncbi:hypothetical protein OGAPHI_004034 [Ogataea philodendri]|uniref:Uncharacterized protein n=1 Tax=Ogataea philodendri TaxID=1378263 RepID=A0A9P8P694_9ASCO|nr:uncharacterized protein OGAPHI_004034 [Ogataea philodendri]KAH3665846.1 hypothetical protein OGAPHI_004034 [Ogataea philodendri]